MTLLQPVPINGDSSAMAECGAQIELLAAKDETFVPKLVDTILDGAAVAGASDVHIETGKEHVLVRYRVDGELLPVARIPKERASNVFARLKLMSRVVTYKKRGPQDGRLASSEGGALRTAFMPTLHGEKAVLRLPNDAAPRNLDDLGLPEPELQRLKQIVKLAQGTIFFTGPCSSGKSTSIYAVLRHLLANSSLPPNIASLEDPIEQEIEGVNQSQIDTGGGLSFISGLRTLLRMDPNVIVVGEVRDEETAHTVIQAGLSGHLVISTIHGGSAAQVFARLLHMNIEPFLVASSINAIVAQRLVRRLCPECKKSRLLSPAERHSYFPKAAAPELIYTAAGCPACNLTGYSGRTAVFEIAIPNEEVREAVLKSEATARIHELCVQAGMLPLMGAATQKLASGETSLDEIARVIG